MIRTLRRWSRWAGPPLSVWFHPAYRLPVPPVHLVPGMSPRRGLDALTWALDEGVVTREEVHEAPEISWRDLARAHDDEYLERLDERAVVADILRVSPDVVSVRRVVESWRRATGGTLCAARWAIEHDGNAVNLSGGFHHAAAARGSGFCGFNDIAVTVRTLRDLGVEGPIVVIDLDAHPPDGVVSMLADDPEVTVLTLSASSGWTLRDDVQATVFDERVEPGAPSAPYLDAVRSLLQRVPSGASLAFYIAGADPLEGDPLGDLQVSRDALRLRDRLVYRALRGIPSVAVAGGGYLDQSWRVLAGTVAEAAGLGVRVRSRYDPVYRRTIDVSRRLDPGLLTGAEDDALISEDELLMSLGAPGRRREPRFLGYYTRHGLERALESQGYLATLRQMGFEGLRVQVDSGAGTDRLWVTARVRGKDQIVVDLTASIRLVERWRTLFMEWLELRDPRVSFSEERLPLPGQSAPGLGLAQETVQLMVRAAERLGLDGVSLIAAHYHVALIAQGRFLVRDPVQRGRLRALTAFLADVPMLEASQMLAGAGLATEDGEMVRWEPMEMVVPMDPDLEAWLAEGEQSAQLAAENLTARLIPLPPSATG